MSDVEADSPGAGDGPPPIFVGGTGRSGTTVTGNLLGQHPRYVVLPVEMKFHADPDGLPGVMLGTRSPEEFRTTMLSAWDDGWSRSRQPIRALARVVSRPELERALDAFVETVEQDDVGAARGLVRAINDAYAQDNGAEGWVEMTPRNVNNAPLVNSMFPESRLINVIRDGRDVVASLVKLRWVTDPFEALAWWEKRMQGGHMRVLRGNPERCFLLNFDRLAVHAREETFTELVAFLGWEDVPEIRTYFDETLTAERAHVGAWRTAFEPDVAKRLNRAYAAAIRRLDRAGVTLP